MKIPKKDYFIFLIFHIPFGSVKKKCLFLHTVVDGVKEWIENKYVLQSVL